MTFRAIGKRFIRAATLRFNSLLYPLSSPGSVQWLIGTERKYGGYVTNVPRNRVSPDDARTQEELLNGGMTGGDRMFHHGYGATYAEFLQPLLGLSDLLLIEVGILRGTGIAMWCDLFPKARVLGLDIDLDHSIANMDNLKALGAFTQNKPELYEFDQFADNVEYLGNLLRGDTVDICIDDGCHSVESILCTLRSMVPHLSERFVYLIEDNSEVHDMIRAAYPNFQVDHAGELTVVFR
jgi:hypothetical protein